MNDTVHFRFVDSPVGTILITCRTGAITRLEMIDDDDAFVPGPNWRPDEGRLDEAASQLREYFAGDRTSFDLELAPDGTPFQKLVWSALREIPYGETTSYAELAARLGRPTAARAVGNANGRNPIGIIVPCHRVIAANGGLGGYAAGLSRKRFLLDLEARGRAGGVAFAA